jgi:hypothetical protein
MILRSLTFCIVLTSLYILAVVSNEEERPKVLSEHQRVFEYHKRGYKWPPEPYVVSFLHRNILGRVSTLSNP